MHSASKFVAHRYDEKLGNRDEELTDNPIKQFARPATDYDYIIDDSNADVIYLNNDTYRLFWNREILQNARSLQKLVEGEQVLGVIFINEYEQPLVVRTEPISDRKAGFVGYRGDGKAIIAGTVDIFEDHIEVESNPVYGKVKFGCLCGAQKKIAKPPKPAPTPPSDRAIVDQGQDGPARVTIVGTVE